MPVRLPTNGARPHTPRAPRLGRTTSAAPLIWQLDLDQHSALTPYPNTAGAQARQDFPRSHKAPSPRMAMARFLIWQDRKRQDFLARERQRLLTLEQRGEMSVEDERDLKKLVTKGHWGERGQMRGEGREAEMG
eukprot:7385395-Prymnesium_polylepis.1